MGKFRLRVAGADTNDLGQYDRLAAFARRAGFQVLACGNLAELTQDQMADRLDSWVRFTAQSAGAFKFVESSVINGVLSKAHIDKNAALLAEKSKILARHGLKGFMHLLEPQWLPETFYAQASGTARAAMRPSGRREEQILLPLHRQAGNPGALPGDVSAGSSSSRRKLMMFSIWGNDSGAGICWCNGLYPGKNGPDYCKDVTMGKRIRKWLGAMLAGGKDAGKQIELAFATYAFGNDATRDILANLPTHASLISWMGSFPNEPFAGKRARDFVADCKNAGRSAYLQVDPTLGYPLGPITEPPVEYFIYDTLGEAAKSGAKYIGVGGLSVDAKGDADGGDEGDRLGARAAAEERLRRRASGGKDGEGTRRREARRRPCRAHGGTSISRSGCGRTTRIRTITSTRTTRCSGTGGSCGRSCRRRSD